MAEPLRVLIAEDRPTDAELVVRALRRAGFEPEWRRVETEEDYVRALGPDLDIVLSDYEMPHFDAPRALRLLRERNLDVPFIIVSGTIGEETAVAAMKDGASDYLIKDRLARLGTAVHQALDQRRERQSRARVEAELKRFVSGSPAVIYALAVKDGALEHVWTSDNVTRLTGHEHEETLSKTWWEANIHPEDREEVVAAHAIPYELDHLLLEYRFHRKDGGWLWVRDEKRLLRDAAGTPVEVVGSWVDITARRQMEASLRASEERVQFALETVGVGAWDLDLESHSAHRTLGHDRIFGYHSLLSNWTYEIFLEHVLPEDRAMVDGRFQAAAETHGDWAFECRIRRADGALRWIWAAGRHGLDEEGRPTRMTGIVQDITERKGAEAALAASEERLRLAMDAAAMGHWELDLATGSAIWSANHFALFGLEPSTARPSLEAWCSLVHPDDLPGVMQAMEDGRQQRTTVSQEYRIRRADNGRITWLSAAGRFQYDDRGEALRFLGVVFDVTARRQAERRRAMQHAITRVLAESTSLSAAAPAVIQAVCEIVGGEFGALWEIDRRGNQLRCAEIWHQPGLSAESLKEQTRQIMFAPGVGLPGRVWAGGAAVVLPDLDRETNFLRTGAAASAGLRGAFGFPILVRGEVIGVLDFLGREMHDPDQELLEMLGAIGSQIGQFIEHRRAEGHLLQAQKMDAVGQLAGGIAHDFNNLLGVILGYAQLASREIGPDHKANRRIEAVCKAAERAAALTRQILTFSRKEAVETRVCDLNHIVEDMEKILRRLIGEDVRLAVALGEDLGRVRADPGQLEQVIMNLAVNARDAMPMGGRLVIETANVALDHVYARTHPEARAGPHVMLSVGDTGEGMAPGTLARIFEPFFTTKEAGKGTGLGLAVVFGIVRQSGGTLSVYSEPGHGSTFKVYLPRVEEKESATATIAHVPARGGSETVLVVEDEEALRSIVVETLREAGYSVLEAADPRGAAAIASQSAQAIDLLLTDVVLPGQSGPETATQLRNARPRLRVLLMSGYTDRLLNGHRKVDPGSPFLSKPFTIDALLRKVREVLDAADPSAAPPWPG